MTFSERFVELNDHLFSSKNTKLIIVPYYVKYVLGLLIQKQFLSAQLFLNSSRKCSVICRSACIRC